MEYNLNTNVNILMGGEYTGGPEWNKKASQVDKCFKIYYLIDGEANIESYGTEYKLIKDSVYFINGYSIDSQVCITFMKVGWLHFVHKSIFLNYILKHSTCIVELDSKSFSSFSGTFKSLNDFFSGNLDQPEERSVRIEIHSLIQYAIAQVFRSLHPEVVAGNEEFNRLLPAMQYINNNFSKNLRLESIASVCNLSPNHFHRLFTETFKDTPFKYVEKQRMNEAVRMLVYTNVPVKEIAYSTGYNDEAYFSRVFTKIHKYSPANYRKKFRKKFP